MNKGGDRIATGICVMLVVAWVLFVVVPHVMNPHMDGPGCPPSDPYSGYTNFSAEDGPYAGC